MAWFPQALLALLYGVAICARLAYVEVQFWRWHELPISRSYSVGNFAQRAAPPSRYPERPSEKRDAESAPTLNKVELEER